MNRYLSLTLQLVATEPPWVFRMLFSSPPAGTGVAPLDVGDVKVSDIFDEFASTRLRAAQRRAINARYPNRDYHYASDTFAKSHLPSVGTPQGNFRPAVRQLVGDSLVASDAGVAALSDPLRDVFAAGRSALILEIHVLELMAIAAFA